MPRVIPPMFLIGAAAFLLTACASPPDLENHLSDRKAADVLSFEDGESLDASTVVGVHAELDDGWLFTDGGASFGYASWANEELGCSLMLVVATPIADLPHDLPDGPGSARLAERYGGPGGEEDMYLYPLLSGGDVDMIAVSLTTGEASRLTLAREFSQLRSAVVLDLGCDGQSVITSVLRGLDVSVTITGVE